MRSDDSRLSPLKTELILLESSKCSLSRPGAPLATLLVLGNKQRCAGRTMTKQVAASPSVLLPVEVSSLILLPL